MEEIILTKSAEETKKIGADFARSHLVQGETLTGKAKVVLLYGNLGAGKTTFVQGLAEGLGIKNRIISPTFIIMRTYEMTNGNFYHVDLYRLEKESDIEGIGLIELMKDPKNIVVIEWPERLGSLLPEKRWELHFNLAGENEREIRVN